MRQIALMHKSSPQEVETEGGFLHILSAIILNCQRGMFYARTTQGKSLKVTIPLVFAEFSTLLLALCVDIWAKYYNLQGINIIAGDFTPMKKAKALGSKLKYCGQISEGLHQELGESIRGYVKVAFVLAWRGDFQALTKITYDHLNYVHHFEDWARALFPMHRHLLESIGIAALNSIRYQRESRGRTIFLSRFFLLLQVFALHKSQDYDKNAQVCHSMGVGIVENDVPHIPFMTRYEEQRGSVLGAGLTGA